MFFYPFSVAVDVRTVWKYSYGGGGGGEGSQPNKADQDCIYCRCSDETILIIGNIRYLRSIAWRIYRADSHWSMLLKSQLKIYTICPGHERAVVGVAD